MQQETHSYIVEGMTCSGCERTVQKVTSNIEGVKSSKADAQSASVTVEFDPEKVSVEKIKSAIEGVGYRF